MANVEYGTRRPGVVTFIGVIIVIQAALALMAGIIFLAYNNSADIQEATNQTSTALVYSGVAELIVGALYAFVGFGILGGSRIARFLVVFVQALGMMGAIWLMLVHQSEGSTVRGLVTILIGVFVIWALYGHRESDEYFIGQGL